MESRPQAVASRRQAVDSRRQAVESRHQTVESRHQTRDSRRQEPSFLAQNRLISAKTRDFDHFRPCSPLGTPKTAPGTLRLEFAPSRTQFPPPNRKPAENRSRPAQPPARQPDAFAIPIWRSGQAINTDCTRGSPALRSPHDVFNCVQYDAYYLGGITRYEHTRYSQEERAAVSCCSRLLRSAVYERCRLGFLDFRPMGSGIHLCSGRSHRHYQRDYRLAAHTTMKAHFPACAGGRGDRRRGATENKPKIAYVLTDPRSQFAGG